MTFFWTAIEHTHVPTEVEEVFKIHSGTRLILSTMETVTGHSLAHARPEGRPMNSAVASRSPRIEPK